MIYISHRGNIAGINKERENTCEYIDEALNLQYDCEIDLWYLKNTFYLGHDKPLIKIDISWLLNRQTKLWIHCKNIFCLDAIKQTDLNYFWHEKDTVCLTSHKFIWAYPGKQPIPNSIAVLPEIYKDDISACIGICSDFIQTYNTETKI